MGRQLLPGKLYYPIRGLMSPTLLTSALNAVPEAEAGPVHKCAIAARLHGQDTCGSKAVLDLAADCPMQEQKGEQANLQYLHMQGCHWVALLKAANQLRFQLDTSADTQLITISSY